MKRLILIFTLALCGSLLTKVYAADYTVKFDPYADTRGNKAEVQIKTICIDGYKYLVTYTPLSPGGNRGHEASTIQMWKQTKSTTGGFLAPEPQKCGE